MSQRKGRMKLSNLLSLILTIAIVVTAGSALIAYTSRDYDTLGLGKFSRGTINTTTGMYEANDATLYTKELVPAMGLEVTPDFDGRVDYQLFWYNVDKSYMGYSNIITDNVPFRAVDVPTNAFYARILLIPRDSLDENGNRNDDFKIAFYEVESYASDVKITYLKNQNFESKDLYSNAPIIKDENLTPEYIDRFMSDDYISTFIFEDMEISTFGLEDDSSIRALANTSEKNTHLFVLSSQVNALADHLFYIENNSKATLYVVTGNIVDGQSQGDFYCRKVQTLSSGKNMIDYPMRGDEIIIIEIEGDPINEHINVYEFAGENLGLIE